MLWRAERARGLRIEATDGTIGHADDLLFDDQHWTVRYLVVDTGGWLSGRKVLLVPSALGHPDSEKGHFTVSLTRSQVESSPNIDTDQPISRQREQELHAYYGWAPYWGMPGLIAGAPGAVVAPIPPGAMLDEGGHTRAEEEADEQKKQKGDPHLRSAHEVHGYGIQALDGSIGHIADFIVDDQSWTIRYLIVSTRNWLPGKEVLLAPQWVREIQWDTREVQVELSREQIRNSPEYDPGQAIDRAYEERLYTHYRRPPYW